MCGSTWKPSNTGVKVAQPVEIAKPTSIAVNGNKLVTVTRKGEIVKVVTGRASGRKDTFTLSHQAAKALAAVLQTA